MLKKFLENDILYASASFLLAGFVIGFLIAAYL